VWAAHFGCVSNLGLTRPNVLMTTQGSGVVAPMFF
jgi:hypothetical protein